MATACARCGYVPASEADAWDCPQCGTTNRPPVAAPTPVETSRKPATRPARPVAAAGTPSGRRPSSARRPGGVTITASPTEFVAVYRWTSWIHFLVALVALGAAAAAHRFLSPTTGLVIGAALEAAAAYVVVMTLANRTTIRATRRSLTSRHGPIPVFGRDVLDALGFWPDAHDVEVPAARLLRVAKGGREIIDLASTDVDETRTKIYLKAVYHDGADEVDVQLLPSTAPERVEDYIGLELDAWLTAAGLPVYTGAGRVDA